jgi:hypothetical protein
MKGQAEKDHDELVEQQTAQQQLRDALNAARGPRKRIMYPDVPTSIDVKDVPPGPNGETGCEVTFRYQEPWELIALLLTTEQAEELANRLTGKTIGGLSIATAAEAAAILGANEAA